MWVAFGLVVKKSYQQDSLASATRLFWTSISKKNPGDNSWNSRKNTHLSSLLTLRCYPLRWLNMKACNEARNVIKHVILRCLIYPVSPIIPFIPIRDLIRSICCCITTGEREKCSDERGGNSSKGRYECAAKMREPSRLRIQIWVRVRVRIGVLSIKEV